VPGSPLWSKLAKEGLLDPTKIDLKKWDFQHPVVPTKYLSVEEVGRLGSWCMREFFSRPHRIHRIMSGNYSELAKLCVKISCLISPNLKLQRLKRSLCLTDLK